VEWRWQRATGLWTHRTLPATANDAAALAAY
jgi:hypothetical protein